MKLCIIGTVGTVLGLGFWGLAGWMIHLNILFSPVYTDVECRLGNPEITEVSFEGGFRMSLVVRTTCYNPNPYKVTLHSTRPVRIFMGDMMTQVAVLEELPTAVLPARGEGVLSTYMSAEPDRFTLETVLAAVFSPSTPLYLEMSIDVEIGINFFLTTFKVSQSFEKMCGFRFQIVFFQLKKVGALACADNLHDLRLPDLPFGGSYTGELELYWYNLAQSEVDRGTKAKNIGLWVSFGIFAALGCAALAFGVVFLLRSFRVLNSSRAVGAKATEVGDVESAKTGEADAVAAEGREAAAVAECAGGISAESMADVEFVEVSSEAETKGNDCGCLATPFDRAAGAGA